MCLFAKLEFNCLYKLIDVCCFPSDYTRVSSATIRACVIGGTSQCLFLCHFLLYMETFHLFLRKVPLAVAIGKHLVCHETYDEA